LSNSRDLEEKKIKEINREIGRVFKVCRVEDLKKGLCVVVLAFF
jgi:hypothetical protein